MKMYKCKKCSNDKKKNEFKKNKACKDGIQLVCRECDKKIAANYYKKNRKVMLSKFKAYAIKHREEIKEYREKYFSSKHGKIMQIMQNIRKRCDEPTNKRFHRYGGRGIKNLLTYDDISMLWERDKANSLVKPSLDRIDVNGNYEIDNCQFIEMKENSRKDLIKSVNQLTIDGDLIKTWEAITYAEKDGFQRANIIKCCKGHRKSHKGYMWSYKKRSE